MNAASAPGKVMVIGEYAVLDGAPAVVAAVNRRAVARWTESSTSLPPEVAATLEVAQCEWGKIRLACALDTTALQSNGIKLGLGSSAAGAVAAAGAVWTLTRGPIRGEAQHREVFQVAEKGHRSVAPGGSGADVAAAALGGVLRVERGESQLLIEPLAWPADMAVRLVWTGQPARTSAFLERVSSFRRRDGSGYARIMRDLYDTSCEFVCAVRSGEVFEMLRAADLYGRIMRDFGVAAGIEIVTESLARVSELARESGGSAKPSGAGGGDVAVALFAAEEDAKLFEVRCAEAGLSILFAAFDSDGVRSEHAL